LSVLKRFGAESQAPLSFPMPGWTLTVDLPVGPPDLPAALADCDRMVVEAGGRLYLAKDSRMSPDMLNVTYPRLSQWRSERDRLDPNRVMQSDLARRLDL
jgi:decaprenylphospho-beta-D-ribofuranose 2-oxidase